MIAIALATLCVMQDTPKDMLEKFTQAVEKKDAEAIKGMAVDRKRLEKFNQEEFEKILKRLNEGAGGHLVQAIKSYPDLGAVHESVTEIELKWEYALKEGVMKNVVRLQKVEGKWKFKRFRNSLDKDRSAPEGSDKPADRAPFATIHEAIRGIETKNWEGLLTLLPEKERDDLTAEKLKEGIEKEQDKIKGRFVEALKRIPEIRERDPKPYTISVKIRYGVKGDELSVEVGLVKEKGKWLVGEVDIDVHGDNSDQEPEMPPDEPKDPGKNPRK